MESVYFKEMMVALTKCEQVEALVLGGSRANGTHDQDSDYDVYVYLNQPLSLVKRKEITDTYCSYMELNNTFWEMEDDGLLKDGIVVELIYRSLEDFDRGLEEVVFKHEARNGYTTCFWHNALHTQILFDRNGQYENLQIKYTLEYPEALKQNIVHKNRSLLKGRIPSYYEQVEKAVKRQDIMSINHRITEFLASYFDIIFALNKQTHPGEKRMITYSLMNCLVLPKDYENNLNQLITAIGKKDETILLILRAIIFELDQVS